ncbi:MAG: flagellar hook-length control protein FliK [Alphaproteobacteria bacterium]
MTDINNMLSLYAARPQTPPQPAVSGQKTPTLSDFVGLLLSPQGTPPDAAALQNMPDNLKALAEKIAALLNGTAPAVLSAAVPDIDTGSMPAALTSDLSAALAATLQNAAAPDAAGDIDMNMLAGLLNNIEPGADALPAAPAATPVAAATPAVAASASAPAVADGDAALQLMMSLKQAQPDAPQALRQNENAPAPAPKPSTAQPAPAAQAAPAVPAHTPVTKADTPLNTLLTAMTSQNGLNAGGGFDSTGGGFGQNGFGQNGFAGGFAGGEAGFGNIAMNGGTQAAFAQYMSANGQALPAQTSQMIAVQIQRNAAAKIDTFTLQLDPADLGRMDIELKFKQDGSMKAHLTVERPETLAMLQKDSAHLERLLQQSGLNTDGQSLSFDLRQQNGGQEKRELQTGGDSNGSKGNITGSIETNDDNTTLRGYIGPRGVNIMV